MTDYRKELHRKLGEKAGEPLYFKCTAPAGNRFFDERTQTAYDYKFGEVVRVKPDNTYLREHFTASNVFVEISEDEFVEATGKDVRVETAPVEPEEPEDEPEEVAYPDLDEDTRTDLLAFADKKALDKWAEDEYGIKLNGRKSLENMRAEFYEEWLKLEDTETE